MTTALALCSSQAKMDEQIAQKLHTIGGNAMIESYKQVKDNVLKKYEIFLPLVEKVKGSGPTTYDSTFDKIKKDVNSIKENSFRLMVVGEAKSGKSTFINAYLGTEILPMDVKQCTSAIVEIRYGERYILKATYADGRQETVSNERAIKEFLESNAAIDDAYRDIPTGMINLQVIIPNEGRIPTDKEIQELLRIIEQENIHKLDPSEYSKRVRSYISDKTPHWKDIAKKIEIEYPFKNEELKGIQIVDSPGVNAEGRIGEITNNYIVNANAVMFLKPVVGATLETKSFKKFLETASADRNPNAMFLVLTRAANETPDHVAQIHEEACKQFPGINARQIIHVDSKVEMFRNRVFKMSEEELKAYMDRKISEAELYRQQLSRNDSSAFAESGQDLDILDDFLETPWYRSRFNRDVYLEKLAELSNFREMDKALNQFARNAHYVLLSQILSGMVTVLQKIEAELREDIDNYKKKADDPYRLEADLLNTQEIIKDLRRKINEQLATIISKYKDADGIIQKRADFVVNEYKDEIQKINPSSSMSIDELEKITFRKIKAFTDFEEEIRKNILAECDEALITFSDKRELNFTSLKPDLTPEMIEEIKTDHQKEAEETYTTGRCFNKETKTRLNQSRFYNLIKDDIQKRLVKIKNDLVTALYDYVTNVTSVYRKELSRNAFVMQERYNKILKDKDNAEEMQEKIQNMETDLEKLEPLLKQILSLKGGVDKNVRA